MARRRGKGNLPGNWGWRRFLGSVGIGTCWAAWRGGTGFAVPSPGRGLVAVQGERGLQRFVSRVPLAPSPHFVAGQAGVYSTF